MSLSLKLPRLWWCCCFRIRGQHWVSFLCLLPLLHCCGGQSAASAQAVIQPIITQQDGLDQWDAKILHQSLEPRQQVGVAQWDAKIHHQVPETRQQGQEGLQTWQCDNSWYFFSNGSARPPSRPFGWKSRAATSQFQPGPCLMISGIHVIQTFRKRILVVDRSDANNSYFQLPGNRGTAYAEEIVLDPFSISAAQRGGTQRPLDIKTNTFCSTGVTDQAGNVLSVGGAYDWQPKSTEGFYSIRQFTPCSNASCDFRLVAHMTSRRWYATAQLLADGRMLVVGGSNDSTYMAYPNVNNPTVEYYFQGKSQGSFFLGFLSRTAPYSLYPFVHLLPSGRVFIFAAQGYILFDTGKNTEIPGQYPSLDAQDASGSPIYRSYPVAGSSALFPLMSANRYQAEIMICGGSSSKAAPEDRRYANAKAPADSSCWRIFPEASSPAWTRLKMCKDPPKCKRPSPRVMPDMVLLPDGSILVINGAEQGYQSIPNAATVPALRPALYFTHNYTWYTVPLAASRIPRGYHSSALLLHDGTVFLSGSNPNQPSNLVMPTFPSEFRTEIFSPPYLYGAAQPVLNAVPSSAKVNSRFTVKFSAYQPDPTPFNKRFTGVLVCSGFSTHGQRHGMRNVNLVMQSWSSKGNSVTATFATPPNFNIAPPTVYWFFILDNGIPCKEAMPLQLIP